eukprot:CAMPEP_0171018262 /NCGR_PEP_ID=MMETSP0736-20130129/28150_1 /TAXON_ID=186038 /ORGANISM="Fragilariopsis kerguelensis, Strain L26-C5" /LENGTH=54 /DNA_ID=CAMNT_0011454709 /DNA_START=23 /DNA_END=184 /DNA_ORIENTATION=+
MFLDCSYNETKIKDYCYDDDDDDAAKPTKMTPSPNQQHGTNVLNKQHDDNDDAY